MWRSGVARICSPVLASTDASRVRSRALLAVRRAVKPSSLLGRRSAEAVAIGVEGGALFMRGRGGKEPDCKKKGRKRTRKHRAYIFSPSLKFYRQHDTQLRNAGPRGRDEQGVHFVFRKLGPFVFDTLLVGKRTKEDQETSTLFHLTYTSWVNRSSERRSRSSWVLVAMLQILSTATELGGKLPA